jgi:Lon protease-like protein
MEGQKAMSARGCVQHLMQWIIEREKSFASLLSLHAAGPAALDQILDLAARKSAIIAWNRMLQARRRYGEL